MGRSLHVKSELVKQVKVSVARNGYPSQQALANGLGLSRDVVSRFLNGKPVDYLNADEICRALNLDLGEMTGYGQPVTEQPKRRVDWGDATDTLGSFSREEEIQTLEKWIIQDHCRLVLIEGMKGMGKNNLSYRLGKRLQEHFDFVIWRSLDQYSSITELISDLYCFFADQPDVNHFDTKLAQKYESLKNFLDKNKCLLILANIHLLDKDNYQFNTEPVNYQKILSWITQEQSLSCVVLTSSIDPRKLNLLVPQDNLARRFEVKGLSVEQIKNLFSNVGVFSGSDEDWQALKRFYSGNLFVLQNIALNIRDNFSKNVALYLSFIESNNPVFNGVEEFLNEQFQALSAVERDVMYWLAIYHHPLNIFELKDIVIGLFGDQLLVIIKKLKLCYFIEGEGEGVIAQPPMIRSFFVNQLIQKMIQEIQDNSPDFLARYPLLITNAKAKIRKDQYKIFLKPIFTNLTHLVGYSQTKERLENILKLPQLQGYTVGNIINLLRQWEGYHFNNQVFATLTIKNADFRAIHLQNTDFSQSEFSNCLFQDGFSNVLSVAFSPDGQYLAMGDNHAQVYLWQVTENRPILHNIITSDNYWVRTVAFSPDSQLLASGGDDNIVYLREVKDRKLVARFEGHIERIRSLSFSPDGQYLASSDDDWTIRIWDLESLQLVTVLNQHQDKVRMVLFSPNGQLISASQDNSICVWQVGSFELIKKFRLSETKTLLRTIALSPDGQTLATGNDDHIIRLWTLDGKFIQDFRGHYHWFRSLTFNPDGSQLASASEDQTIRIWDVKTSQCLHVLKDHKARIWSIAYHPQRSWLVAGDDSRKIKLWDTDRGECLGRFEGYSQKIGPLSFHPNGQVLATQSIIDEDNSNCFKLLLLPTDSWNILSLVYDAQGEILVAGSDDNSVKVWDCFDLENPPKSLLDHQNWIRTVAVSADSQFIASGSDDKTVKLWDSRTYKCLHTFSGHTDWVRSVCFDPKGQFLASGSDDGTIKLWNINKPYELKTILRHNLQKASGRDPQVWAIAISPDGKILASGSNDNSITIWNLEELENGRPLNLHQHRKWIAALAFSPDGKWLASTSYDTTIRLWELASGRYQCEHILQGHAKAVTAIAFHPSEPILVSSSKDGSIKQWDLNRFQCIATWKSPRPYENMNITGVTGLNTAQKQCLKLLGAVEHQPNR